MIFTEPKYCALCENPTSLCECNSEITAKLAEIIDQNLRDVFGYSIHRIARECYFLGKKTREEK